MSFRVIMKHGVSAVVLALLLTVMFVPTFNLHQTRAEPETVSNSVSETNPQSTQPPPLTGLNVGGNDRAREMTVNIKDLDNHENLRWAWNVIDNESRFWLASQITEKREIADARKVLAQASSISQTRPMAVVTDGLRAYQDAITKEFFTQKAPRTEHVRIPNIRDRSNNNMIERLHGTIRQRNKVMRGLDDMETAQTMMDGLRIYYNFLRPNSALSGKTPAQQANIDLKLGKNKWLTLIQNANKHE